MNEGFVVKGEESIEFLEEKLAILGLSEREAARNKEKDSFLPFHAGSFKIAEKSHCPVVPVAIVNASAMFEDQFPKIKPVRVIIEYGEPIYPDQLDKAQKKNLCGMTEAEIKRMYFKNKELL